MAFNPDLFRNAWGDVFSSSRGSCTWIEQYMVYDLASKVEAMTWLREVKQQVEISGTKHNVVAYQVDIGDTETYYVTDSSNSDLPGTLCHFYDGFTRANVLRYFFGGLYFDGDSKVVERLARMGYEIPTVPGVASRIVIDILGKLEISVHSELNSNIDGMAQWVNANYPAYARVAWPTNG